ncbi:peptidoglycan-binding domain-containing protein [Tranquillimonas alkanivorans]|uniref:Putative peptidoglycan binding domain-containing protein n=1 Tax=Tranquillimonas alkanivorans TaxID=441119 RepID=A0A1I5KJJ7_9RHOB|nr:peptidoglycan-binding domain-containing protein [Tranquillimonas alkanivorans]SFO85057.1 Putative peptidoglycan binding domain-containing protein [Tranquillimonas alkanivorans]
MGKSHYLTIAAAAAIALAPATRVSADAGDFVAGAIAGAIFNNVAKNQPRRQVRTRTVVKRPRIPATHEGRQIQTSLNYFGFNAGTVDGQLGGNSRAAISRYQAYMGYPTTGQLTPFEQDLLVDSYHRAQAAGPMVHQLIASNPDGTRGLLRTWRAEMAGVPATTMAAAPVPAPQAVVTAAPVAPPAATTTTTTTTVTAAAASTAAPEVEEDAPAGLPNLFGGATTEASLASHCNKVSLLTSSNGGFMTLASMNDPDQALNEQFCLARTYAIAAGEELAAGLPATDAQIAEHCAAYGAQMRPHVSAVSVKERPEVVRDVSSFVLGSGLSTQDLAATAKVCLSVGYRTDDLDVALGSALILVTLGERGYSELLGHHLSQGFGATRRTDLAMDWYADGLSTGTTAVFAPGQPERADLIRAAVTGLGGGADAALTQPETPQKASLPTFSISQ